jgi:hypothetical protein
LLNPTATHLIVLLAQQAFAVKQLQKSSGARVEEAITHRPPHDRAGVDQQLGARVPPRSQRGETWDSCREG